MFQKIYPQDVIIKTFEYFEDVFEWLDYTFGIHFFKATAP